MAATATPPKVWVTGARGMLGQALVSILSARQVAVVPSGRELDICARALLEEFCERERPTHLINCAAMTAVDRCESEEALALEVNGTGPTTLGEVAAQFDLVAAHVSTDYVFDGRSKAPIGEHAPCAPASQYGKSKLVGERGFLQATQERGLVVRTSWLFGAHGGNFVATMLKLMAEREELHVVSDQRGRPTATSDLAAALVALVGLAADDASAAQPQAPGGIYHFANDGEVSWFDFANAILAAAREHQLPLKCARVMPVTSEEFVRPAPRPAYSVLNTRKVAEALGYTPRPFTEPLREYIAQHTQHS